MKFLSRLGSGRPIGARAFCVIAVVAALVLFALPFPPKDQANRLAQIMTTHPKIVVVGASTMSYAAKCDADRRAIPRMIADLTGLSVLDLSKSGQRIADSVNLSVAAAGMASATDVVLPISYSHIDEWTTSPYRQLLVYKMASPRFPLFQAASLADFWSGLSDKPMRYELGYRFEGKDYPDYRVIADTQFRDEYALEACPEVVTHDPVFTRSYFWWTHLKTEENPALYDMLAAANGEFARRGKRLHVVMMPANLQLMRTMDPAWPEAVQRREDHVVAELSRRGLAVLDLSKSFDEAEFSTQWCACIHLTEVGRLHMAQAIARDIPGAMATLPPPAGRFAALITPVADR